jgi:hypothetical protein
MHSKISPNRELDLESEQSAGNEVSIVVLISKKLSKALGLEDMLLPQNITSKPWYQIQAHQVSTISLSF